MELHLLNHVGLSAEAVKVNCSPSLAGARWLESVCRQICVFHANNLVETKVQHPEFL